MGIKRQLKYDTWITCNYLLVISRRMTIFPISSNLALQTLINKMNNTLKLEEVYEHKVLNKSQLEIGDMVLEELSVYSNSGIELLFLNKARDVLSEGRAILRNDKLNSLGI